MKIKLDMDDVEIVLGNNGITLKIADNAGKHVGSLRIGRATVEWRKGKVTAGNGKKIKVEALIAALDAA